MTGCCADTVRLLLWLAWTALSCRVALVLRWLQGGIPRCWLQHTHTRACYYCLAFELSIPCTFASGTLSPRLSVLQGSHVSKHWVITGKLFYSWDNAGGTLDNSSGSNPRLQVPSSPRPSISLDVPKSFSHCMLHVLNQHSRSAFATCGLLFLKIERLHII